MRMEVTFMLMSIQSGWSGTCTKCLARRLMHLGFDSTLISKLPDFDSPESIPQRLC